MNDIITNEVGETLQNKVNFYLNLPYKINVQKLSESDGGGFFANYVDFPFIMGDGETELDAINDVKKAFAFVIECDLKEGKFIKLPAKENNELNDDVKVNINISISKKILDVIDKITTNRSEFFENAANVIYSFNNINLANKANKANK